MNTTIILFFLIVALIMGAASMAVTARDRLNAALWLFASLAGIGALYALLEAPLIAALQLLVNLGAVAVLLLAALQLTRHDPQEAFGRYRPSWWIALSASVVLFIAVISPGLVNQLWDVPPPVGPAGAAAAVVGPSELGQSFVREYLLQLQFAGVLLFITLAGASMLMLRSQKLQEPAKAEVLPSAPAEETAAPSE